MIMPAAVRLRLKEILRELGWTQNELAERSGLSRQTITNLVHDPDSIKLETMSRLVHATGKSLDELFAIEETPGQ